MSITPIRSWNAFSATATKPTGRPLATATKTSRSSFVQVDLTASAWFAFQEKAGLPHIRLHDLRHGMATMALADQVNAELVRRRIGHSRISTTVDLYRRHEVEEVERSVGDGLGATAEVCNRFSTEPD